jgi:succinate dehydrogenase / fumarate reductase membrane anchor subunit
MSQLAIKSTQQPAAAQETVIAWLIKIVTGPLLIIILLIHLIVNHFVGSIGGLMSYDDVVAYFRNPLIPAMEIIFLITVVTHSLIGLRSIFLDLNPSPKAMKVINWALSLVGVGSVLYGIWLAFVIASKGG